MSTLTVDIYMSTRRKQIDNGKTILKVRLGLYSFVLLEYSSVVTSLNQIITFGEVRHIILFLDIVYIADIVDTTKLVNVNASVIMATMNC